MVNFDKIKKLEGKQTVDTASEILNLTRQSTINLLSKLKKQGHVTVTGGGKQKKIYTIKTRKINKENKGMFDILNKYSKEKINPFFIHEPHFEYKVEHAIVDLIELNDIRILINMPPLFNQVKNWHLLYSLGKKRKLNKQIGAMYDVSRQLTKVRKMPDNVRSLMLKNKSEKNFSRSSNTFTEIEKEWNVNIPFNKEDFKK